MKKRNYHRKNQHAKSKRKKLVEGRQRETTRLDVQLQAKKLVATGWINAVKLLHAIEQHERDMPRFRKSYAFEKWSERFI